MSIDESYWSSQLEEGKDIFDKLKHDLDKQNSKVVEVRKLRRQFKHVMINSMIRKLFGLTLLSTFVSWICFYFDYTFLSNFLLNISAGLVTAIVVLFNIELVRERDKEIEEKFQTLEILFSDVLRSRMSFYRLSTRLFNEIKNISKEEISDEKKRHKIKGLQERRLWTEIIRTADESKLREHMLREESQEFVKEIRSMYNVNR